ncbi:MAG: diaminopimelate epimerase [Alphaproteobacteria bacterium]|nr:diaminopimelate epimerase [Alphaproteobacteria bacterium]
MHGIGNDFVVLDARARPITIDAGAARAIADRRTGVGCDQLIVVEPSEAADVFMRIRNSDGGEVEACGNGARCVASLVLAETGRDEITIETLAGILPARRVARDRYSVGMGVPGFDWHQVPLASEMDTLHLDLAIDPASRPVLADPVALSIGNPHAVFFVDDVAAVDIATVGPMLEHHPLFPERANIGIAQVLAPDRLRLRVWERGAGLTQACGSGACAAAVAAARRDYTGRRSTIELDGGELGIHWRESDGQVLMTGPVATAFEGALSPGLVAPAEAAE